MPSSSPNGPSAARAWSPTERSIAAWRSPLAQLMAGLLVFETATGVLVWLLPFSLSAQFMVLAHTAVGLVFTAVWAVQQVRHWLSVRSLPFTHHKVTGWASLGLVAGCAGTGVLLTWQGLFATRISYLADTLHIVTGLAAFAVVAVHVATLLVRDARRRRVPRAAELRRAKLRYLAGTGVVVFACTAGLLGWRFSYAPPDLSWDLPEGYSMSYGEGRPFAPSLATTADGAAVHPRRLSGSSSCGSSGCHDQIYEEWLPSAHRYASVDVAFQAVQKVMAENEGPDSTRYCAGCHDPIALFSGSKNIYDEDLSSPGAEEGVSCIACHRLVETDVKGNASYVVDPPDFYAYELEERGLGKLLSDFLIRTYPRHHVAQYSPPLLRSPEYCGACHKQFIDEEINDFGWVQLQNQYDNWRKSHWNREGDPGRRAFCGHCHERKGVEVPAGTEDRCSAITTGCRECHMRLTASTDPAAGDPFDLNRHADDGLHRNHRFIGANQFMPQVLDLPGWEEHVRLTEEWLRGETVLPEIAHKWPVLDPDWAQSGERRPRPETTPSGPVLPIRIHLGSEVARPGEEVSYGVEILSRKVGHDFPTGPLDIIQCWVHTEVTDADGRVVYHSGRLTDDGFVEEGSFVFKAEGIDAQGNLIDRHNLWELVGARFKRALFPGFTDTAEFGFRCPSGAGHAVEQPRDEEHAFTPGADVEGPLRIRARLMYRKINQHLLNVVTGRKDVRAPVTVMTEAEAVLPVEEGR